MAFGDRPGERSHFYLRDAFADDRLAGFQARQHTYVPAVGGAELHFPFGIPLVVELHEYEVNTLILRYGAQRHTNEPGITSPPLSNSKITGMKTELPSELLPTDNSRPFISESE